MVPELALTWQDIDATATTCSTCIRETMPNNIKAQADWEEFPGHVEYWLGLKKDSYTRVVRLTSLWNAKPLWLFDYCIPFTNEHLITVAEAIDGWLLVSRNANTASIKDAFGPFPLPELVHPKGVRYIARALEAQEWWFIRGQARVAVNTRVTPESPLSPSYED